MLDKFKALSEIFTYIDEKLGFRKFTQYAFLVLLILGVCNFRVIIRTVLEVSNDISEEQHSRKMGLRDELLDELNPILTEMRATVRADRVLYLEYHNSKGNLVGIPFKYIDLVLSVKQYGVSDLDYNKYKEINSGVITTLYQDLRKTPKAIISKSLNDPEFQTKYLGVTEYINNSDGSRQQVFLSLPGVNTPIGLIILEWMDEEERDWEDISRVSQSYITRINGLVLRKSEQRWY